MGKTLKSPVMPEMSTQMDPRFVSGDTEDGGNNQLRISSIQHTRP